MAGSIRNTAVAWPIGPPEVSDHREDALPTAEGFPAWGQQIDISPGEVGHEEPRDPSAPRSHQRHGGCVAEHGRGPLLDQSSYLIVQPPHGLGIVAPSGELEGRRSVGRGAVAVGTDGAHIRDVGLQFCRPPQPLAPVLEQVPVRPDRHRHVRRHPVQHGRRPVQMAESVAGHIHGQPATAAVVSAHQRVPCSSATARTATAGRCSPAARPPGTPASRRGLRARDAGLPGRHVE